MVLGLVQLFLIALHLINARFFVIQLKYYDLFGQYFYFDDLPFYKTLLFTPLTGLYIAQRIITTG